MLDVWGSIPAGGKEDLVSEHTSLRVICRDDMNTVHHPSDRKANKQKHSLVVKYLHRGRTGVKNSMFFSFFHSARCIQGSVKVMGFMCIVV